MSETFSEEVIRRATLWAAAVCWLVSLTTEGLIIAHKIHHEALGLIVFTLQGLAITLTIVWAQFRNRRVMIEVMKAGLRLGRLDQRTRDLDN